MFVPAPRGRFRGWWGRRCFVASISWAICELFILAGGGDGLIVVLRRSGFEVAPFRICVPGRGRVYVEAHLSQGRPSRFRHRVLSGHGVRVKSHTPCPGAAAV